MLPLLPLERLDNAARKYSWHKQVSKHWHKWGNRTWQKGWKYPRGSDAGKNLIKELSDTFHDTESTKEKMLEADPNLENVNLSESSCIPPSNISQKQSGISVSEYLWCSLKNAARGPVQDIINHSLGWSQETWIYLLAKWFLEAQSLKEKLDNVTTEKC